MGASYQRSAWSRRQRQPGYYIQFRNWNPDTAVQMTLSSKFPTILRAAEPAVGNEEIVLEFYSLADQATERIVFWVLGVGEEPPSNSAVSSFGHVVATKLKSLFPKQQVQFATYHSLSTAEEA